MAERVDKEFLYRKLKQTRRLIAGPLDPVTIERLKVHVAALENELAAIEAREADAPPE
jgi:hypothetical protein